MQGKGYVLLPELFTPHEIFEARSYLLELAKEEPAGRILKVDERSRLYGLLDKVEIFEQMVQHPQVIEVAEAILGNDMTLGGFSAHIFYLDFLCYTRRLRKYDRQSCRVLCKDLK